jgi:hypothetical protein
MFFSEDKKLLIKTMNDSELTVFMKALYDYFMHVHANKNSLLARIYGVYTIIMEEIEPVNVLIMANSA